MKCTNIKKELAALNKMTPKQLRERYADLYGEPSRSGNKQWLVRRCAWRIQALAEGGLSERAERRAWQLARDQDIRVIPPKNLSMDSMDRPSDIQQPARNYIRRTHDSRLPMPGEQITRVYKGHLYVVDVLDDGFDYDGQRYQSLSAVAHAITGGHWNGFKFFNREQPGKEAESTPARALTRISISISIPSTPSVKRVSRTSPARSPWAGFASMSITTMRDSPVATSNGLRFNG